MTILPDALTPEAATVLAADPDATLEEIREMQDIVTRSGDPMWATRFAIEVPDADIAPLQQVIFDHRDPEWAALFAVNVPGADIDSLEQIVVGTAYHEMFYDAVNA